MRTIILFLFLSLQVSAQIHTGGSVKVKVGHPGGVHAVAMELDTSTIDGPTNFALLNIEGGVRLTWTDTPDNTGDVLIYRSVSGSHYSLLTSVTAGTQTYDDVISGNYTLCYKIRQEIEPITFCDEYIAVQAQMTTLPSDEVADYQNAFLKALVDSCWSAIDGIWLFASHTNNNSEALINWRYPTYDKATLPVAPTFAANTGFTGNGTSQYINLLWNPTDNGTAYTLNSASVLIACQDNGTKGNLFGDCYWSPSNHYSMCTYSASGMLNSAYATTGTTIAAHSKKYISFIRSANNSIDQYINKGTATHGTTVSSVLSTKDYLIFNYNYNGSPNTGTYNDGTISAVVVGNFNEAQKNIIINAIETYLDYLAHGII